MKTRLGRNGIYAASVAAAAVLLSASPAAAEARAAEFETEFELDLAPAVEAAAAAVRPAESNKPCLDGVAGIAHIECAAATAASWETAIGAYLDGLLERSRSVADILIAAPAEAESPVLTVEQLSAAAPGYEPGSEADPAPAVQAAPAVEAAAVFTAVAPECCPLKSVAEAGGWRILAAWASERTSSIAEVLNRDIVRQLPDHSASK